MRSRAAVLLACTFANAAVAGDPGHFVGRVAVEWIEGGKGSGILRLLEPFGFEEPGGLAWTVPAGQTLDGSALPPLFRSTIGAPFDGPYRRAAVLLEHFSRERKRPWRDVQRMFHAAALAGGVDAADARLMYMAVYAQGPRWETRTDSHCYDACHAAAASLAWKPVVSETELRPVMDWIDHDTPDLDEIERRVDAVTKRPGPHLFAQGH